jgi:ABC-2 type transport system ATP-binding protein
MPLVADWLQWLYKDPGWLLTGPSVSLTLFGGRIPMQTALEARNLVKRYPGVVAVNDVSFSVAEGICFGLLGPNGAGKTTTVEIIEGVTPATSGEVFYFGEPAGRRFREEAGIQFQNTALQDYLTVRETLQMFQKLYDRHADLDRIIEDCSLGELLDRDNRKLSGGQRQRLFLAVALVNAPRLVFLDEPTTGLDPQARRNFWTLVQRIQANGTTIILTTHYMDEAHVLCDEIAIMDAGRIISRGAPDELLRNRYDGLIIELPLDDVSGELDGIEHVVYENQGIVEIMSTDVSASLEALAPRVDNLNRIKIRQPNLEDLFLDLTGHSLRA